MKRSALIFAAILLFLASACNKSELQPPLTQPDPNANKFAGEYVGLFEESYNGASNDSGGVFKHDTSYYYTITVSGIGPDTISIEKGAITLNSATVFDNEFFLIYHNHQIYGQFVNDSLYLHSKALTGLWDPLDPFAEWFAMQNLDFKGRKIY